MRFHGHAIGYIDADRKEIFDAVHDADIVKQADRCVGTDFDHDVDIAVGLVVATRPRAEQGGARDTALAQGALVFAKAINDLLSILNTSPPRKRFTCQPEARRPSSRRRGRRRCGRPRGGPPPARPALPWRSVRRRRSRTGAFCWWIWRVRTRCRRRGYSLAA